jgi:hypothetical protein
MNEFLGPDRPFDIISSDEIEPVVEQADRAIQVDDGTNPRKALLPTMIGCMDWTSLSNEKFEFFDITTGTTPGGTKYIQVGKRLMRLDPAKTTETTYLLDIETGSFIVVREDYGAANAVEVEEASDSRSDDVNAMMFELGQYRPDGNDWNDCKAIIANAETHALRMRELKKAEEEAAQQGTIANVARDILLRAFSDD